MARVPLQLPLIPRHQHLERVFQIRSGANRGTAFALESGQGEYFVTALHVVEKVFDTMTLDFLIDNAWKPLGILAATSDAEYDVAVFRLTDRFIAQGLAPIVTDPNVALGEEVFYLGFPFGLAEHRLYHGSPVPFIKRGVISNIALDPLGQIYLATTANRGFSGAPVFAPDAVSGVGVLCAVLIESLGEPVDALAGDDKIAKVFVDSNIARCTNISRVLPLVTNIS